MSPEIRARALAAGLLLTLPASAMAQQAATGRPSPDSLIITGNVSSDRFIDRHTAIEFSLSRPLASNEGELVVIIGSVDVTDLLERNAMRVIYRPRITPLPTGEREVVVYRRARGTWVELQRFALKVLRRGGLVRVSLTPTATLGNNGQLVEGHSAGMPAPPRSTFQDFTLTSGWRSTHEGIGWGVEIQSNVVGASNRQQALRFAQRGDHAPKIDLSDYLVRLRIGSTHLSLGHVGMGTNRHLVNALGSRGVTLAADVGSTKLTLGALNGSSIVGWSNPVGLDQSGHRVVSAALGTELIRRRPGALHIDVSLLNGSLLPQTSFNQGSVVDAEQSRGAAVQVSASTADQRLRLSGGYARSRFSNPPRDRQLLGDSAIRPVRPETRGARFVEVTLGLLQGVRAPVIGATSLNTTYRHERVDPLYRSVAANTQADQQQHAFDVNATAGSITAQLTHARSHDNLDAVPSVLRSVNRQSAASLTLPLPSVARFRAAAQWLPTLTYSVGRTHQFAADMPTNGDFRPTDLPDQVSLAHNAEAQWQAGSRLRSAYRFSASDQDNRQPTRERADFAARTHGVTLALALGGAELSADVSDERQLAKERDEATSVRRIAFGVTWRPSQGTSILALMSTIHSRDAARAGGARNNETRFELSQGVLPSGGSSRGQLFLRYALTAARVPADAAFSRLAWQKQWTLSSGLNLRLF